MESDSQFEAIWRRYADFKLAEESEDLCVFAQEFREWTKELCAKATQQPTIVSTNQNKILLLEKFFEWRSATPKNHRNRIGKVGHVCTFQVFEQAYQTLKAVELSLTPPMLFVPPPPSPPVPAAVPGIFLGELDKS